MLMEVKNQLKVTIKSIKYNIMRQMLNKVTFVSNIIFMILNNACFLIQWIILFNLKETIGGYDLQDVFLLWALAASTYGVAHIICHRAFQLPELIINGKLDQFLVQPKDVLISAITSDTSISAIGDLLYGIIVLFACKPTIQVVALFTFFTITGAIIVIAFAVIVGSLSFWFIKADNFSENLNGAILHFATYPDSIFKNSIKLILYTVIPVGIANYMPLHVMLQFNFFEFFIVILGTIFISILSYVIFNIGLKRYSSTNLMGSRDVN